MASPARQSRGTIRAEVRSGALRLMLVALGVSSLVVAFSAAWGPVLAHVLSGLRGDVAIAASGLIVVLAAVSFIAIGGGRGRPVAFAFAAAVVLCALTFLSRISWVGERF